MEDKYPKAIQPFFSFSETNPSFTVYSGEIEFREPDGLSQTGKGSITWNWFPHVGLRFDATTNNDAKSLFKSNHLDLDLKGGCAENGFVTQATRWARERKITGYIEKIYFGDGGSLVHLDFYLPNFPNFIGEIIEDEYSSRKDRLSLQADEWVIHIDRMDNADDILNRIKREGAYGFTHIGRIFKQNKQPFRYDDTRPIFNGLAFFLSFIRGLWTQPVLFLGYNFEKQKNSTSWLENLTMEFINDSKPPIFMHMGNSRIEPWVDEQNWHNIFVGSDNLSQLFNGFWKLWSQENSREVLKQLIGWYLEINTSVLQSKLILGQVALEMMSYEILTDENGNEPATNAERRITELLNKYNIVTSVPPDLSDLKMLANESVLKNSPSDPEFSGPGILVTIRNALVHSKRAKRNKRSSITNKHYFEAAQLALWYLELTLLHWMGYDGHYTCRWRKNGVVKNEPVLWTMP